MGGIFKADFQPVANPKTVPLGDESCVFAQKNPALARRVRISGTEHCQTAVASANCRSTRYDGITLTCLNLLRPLHRKNDFKNEKASAAQHAGELQFNLIMDL